MYFTVQMLGIDTICHGIAFPHTVQLIDIEVPKKIHSLCLALGGSKLNFQTIEDIIAFSRLELSSCKQRKALLHVSNHDITRTLNCVSFFGGTTIPDKLTSFDFQGCICLNNGKASTMNELKV